MGLDMFLTASKYQMGDKDELTEAVNPVIDTKGYPVQSITISACYWRKANQIHNWFVENVQDGVDECKRHHVEVETLRRLVDICKEVLADHSKADDLLPTQAGFFFGDTGYTEYYYADLQHTVDTLTPFITDPDWQIWDFNYQSSW